MKDILVIEDSEVETLYLKGLVDRIAEAEVSFVRSYKEGIKLCRMKRYDLIIADAIVSEGDAADFLTQVRNTGLNADTNAVVMGSDDDFEGGEYLDKTGYANYITKPVKFNMLRAAILMYA